MAEKMLAGPRHVDWEAREKAYDKAYEKARDINFSTHNNPLVFTTPQEAYAKQRIEQNMDALRMDARRRENPATGRIYASIMDMRYGGE